MLVVFDVWSLLVGLVQLTSVLRSICSNILRLIFEGVNGIYITASNFKNGMIFLYNTIIANMEKVEGCLWRSKNHGLHEVLPEKLIFFFF